MNGIRGPGEVCLLVLVVAEAAREVSESEGATVFCEKCSEEVTATYLALECEICEVWYHIAYENIPNMVYKFMVDSGAGRQFNWNCTYCKRGCCKLYTKMKKLEQQHKELQGKQSALVYTVEDIKNNTSADHAKHQENKDKITQVEGEILKIGEKMEGNIKGESEHTEVLKDMADKLETEVYQKLMPSRQQDQGEEPIITNKQRLEMDGDMFEEWNQRKLREKNILIYGVKESNSSGIDDRVKHDQLFVKSLLDTCGVETGPSFMEVIGKMVRLGKRTEERVKGRPLLVQFVQGNLKRKLFSKISMLRGKPEYNDVSISHDLTKLQRAREAALYEEAKNMTESAPADVKYGVRCPPWKGRVIKLKKKEPLPKEHVTPRE